MTEDSIPYGASSFTRLCSVFTFYSEKELIKKFKTTAKKLSLVEQTGIIPAEWLLVLLREDGINPEWINTGKGAKRLMPSLEECLNEDVCGTLKGSIHLNEDAGGVQRCMFFTTQFRPPMECSSEELLKELVRRAVADIYSQER